MTDVDIRPTETPEANIRKQRSRITNGRKLPGVIDGRSPWIRFYKDSYRELLSDFGGEDNATVADQWKAHCAAVIRTELRMREAKFANGQASDADFDLYQRGSGNLRRLLESPTVERKPKDITTLSDYLADKQQDADETQGGER